MLIIVMHNNQDYLDHLANLARREGIRDITIVKKERIGTRLIGGDASFILSRGKMLDAYGKAFVAVVKGEERTKHFLDVIEQDRYLDIINIQDKGFVCAVPFHYITRLGLESSTIKKEEEKMKIGDYLREDRILLDLKSHSKDESIKEISALLKDAEEITDFDSFLNDVFEREKLATTGIGNELAIPHARTDAVRGFVIAFGRSQEGVEFNSLDGKPAKLILLMGTHKEKNLNNYLKTLAHLSRLLKRESFKSLLLKASSPGEIIDAFKKAEAQGA
jgi:fructose-specific phosphotransferase system IIA component